MTTTLVLIDLADAVEARLAGSAASVAVRFAAKLVSVTREKAGTVVEGSPNDVEDHLDVWTLPATSQARPGMAAVGNPDGALSGRTSWRRRRRRGPARRDAAAATARIQALAGFAGDDALAAFAAFRDWARAAQADAPPLRTAKAPSPRLLQAAQTACSATVGDADAARRFFFTQFRAWRIFSDAADGSAFFTGYYEPEVDASLSPTSDFRAPALARPPDLVSFPAARGHRASIRARGGATAQGWAVRPLPRPRSDRSPGREAVVWLADSVEVFFVQVQGSARLRPGRRTTGSAGLRRP